MHGGRAPGPAWIGVASVSVELQVDDLPTVHDVDPQGRGLEAPILRDDGSLFLGERRLPLGPGRLLVGRARDEGDADLVLADLRPVVILVPVELVLAIEAGQAP